jgi:pyruvate dehydrogenase E1 component alpha subunit
MAQTKQASKQKKPFNKDTYKFWYQTMQLIRDFEFNAYRLVGEGKIRGFCHVYMGEEAVATGAVSASHKDDKIITAYRDHGHALAVGMDPKYAMAELFGKIDGCSKGKGGSMHLFSKEHNFFGGHGIVGGVTPLGTGIGFAEKYKNTGNICLTFLGDGAVLQGSFHESLNMAMTWKLPVVYVIENNQYGMGTAVERVTNVTELYKKACEFEMPAERVDGMNVETVHNAITKAAKRAREEHTPTLLEMNTYRYKGHSISDPATYRSREELKEWQQLDPIEQVIESIRQHEIMTEEEIKQTKKDAQQQVKNAIEFADNSPLPDESQMYKDVYIQSDYPYLVD